MHNHDDHKGMMWMMVLCCAIPFIFLLFAGSSVSAGGYLKYVIIGGLAVVCFWMMFKGHGGHGGSHEDHKTGASGEPETKETNKQKGCH